MTANMTGAVPAPGDTGMPLRNDLAGVSSLMPLGAQSLLRAQSALLAAIERGEPLKTSLAQVVAWLAEVGGIGTVAVLFADLGAEGCRWHAGGLSQTQAQAIAAAAPALVRSGMFGAPGAWPESTTVDVRNGLGLPEDWRAACLAAGIERYVIAPLQEEDNRPSGFLLLAQEAPVAGADPARCDPQYDTQTELAAVAARIASLAIRQSVANEAMGRLSAHLEADLADTRLLQGMSVRVGESGMASLFDEIVAAAVEIMGSDFASIQMLYPDRGEAGELRLLGNHGFDQHASQVWEWVGIDSSSTCGIALRDAVRVHVVDLEDCDGQVSGEDLETYRHLGIRSVQTTPLLARNGQLLGMISTHWKQPHRVSERDLRLFDILVRQAADLVQQNINQRELQNQARQKDVFLAQLAHELRNPLAPLRTVGELMLRKPEDAELAHYAGEVVTRQVGYFSRLVDDLLDVSRITRDQIELRIEGTTLEAVTRLAIEITAPTLKSRQQRLQLAFPRAEVAFDADPVRLSQVFANLLVNASKYSAVGAPIWFEGETGVTDDGREYVEVRVRDAGLGIAAEHLEAIFGLFFQGPAPVHGSSSGLGVGLALARRLVTLHEGTVTAHSDGPGKGAEFRVRLPGRRVASAADAPAQSVLGKSGESANDAVAEPERQPSPLRILIADDNVDAAESLGEILRLSGHQVHLAHNGDEAVLQADRLQPDAVLLDIGMPGRDGYQVCRHIRSQPWATHAALVALSGYGTEGDRRRSAEAGFARHLTKPADIQALLAYLNAVSLERGKV